MSDIREGTVVPIPCRACGKELVPFKLARGHHSLPCPGCRGMTEISVALEAGELRVRTRRAEAPTRGRALRNS